MSEERKTSLWARTFEFMGAAIIGALASKLFDVYWNMKGIESELIVGGYIIVVLIIVALGFMAITVGIETIHDIKRRRKQTEIFAD